MALEIERRFIARARAELLSDAPSMELVQGYLTVRDAITVRIRREGARWVLAIKADASGIARHEIEAEVAEDDGRALLDLARAAGGTVEKTRHTIGRWEIDSYRGRFRGLTLAEVELRSEEEPMPEPPAGLELIREINAETDLSSRGLAAMAEAEARDLVGRLY